MAYPLKEIYRGYLFLNITYIILHTLFSISYLHILRIIYSLPEGIHSKKWRLPPPNSCFQAFNFPIASSMKTRTPNWELNRTDSLW